MRKSITIAALMLAAGHACGQWADNFDRPSLGASWVSAGGVFSNFSIVGNQGAHTSGANDAMKHATAAGPYQLSSQTVDLHMNGTGVQYVALASGYGAGNNLYLKVQSNSDGVFNRLGFYSGLNNTAGWPGPGALLVDLTPPFTDARMQVYFTDGGDTANVVLDTNFDGVPDQSYSRSGVRAFMTGSGTGFGIGAFGDSRFDDWRIMPAIVPSAASAGYYLVPFGAGATNTMHQVFRSGLWSTPVRITGVRYAPSTTGAWAGNVAVNLGYTTRTPGVGAPTGLDYPTGASGAPNATGPLFPYFSNPSFSQTFVAGVAPAAEDFQLAFNASPGFVYFPGMGNLLMETKSTMGATLDLAVSRSSSGSDSSGAYASSRFGNGTTLAEGTAPQVQLVAMPYTPDVLPTWPLVGGNALPFALGQSLTHQVHHAQTIAPLGAGGSGKVAIQGLKFAPYQAGTVNGPMTVRLGYTARVPGVAAPTGLDVPTAGGGGAPNATGAMRQFMSRSLNLSFPTVDPADFQIELHQTPFVFDPAQGNLLIEFDANLATSLFASRANGSPEASRAYRAAAFGTVVDTGRGTLVKFVTTPVTEQVYPNVTSLDGLGMPFSPGVHVLHQVFSASQFGTEPVWIDSIAYGAQIVRTISSDVTVRMGYTSRQPNVFPPLGLSTPDAGGEGAPNATVAPMAVFRSGPFPVAVTSVGANTFQIVLKGDAPFRYNPALGNLLIEVVSTASNVLPVYTWLSASTGSSIASRSTTYGAGPDPAYAPRVKFTYFKDVYPCVADMNGDNTVDLNDFFAFLGCWDLSGQCADVDGTPGVDLNDFFAFLGSWDVGC